MTSRVGLAEQLVRMGVLVVALLRVPAADRGADRLDDHDLTALLVASCQTPSKCGQPVAPGASDRRPRAPDICRLLYSLTGESTSGAGAVRGTSSGSAGSGAIACGLAATAAAARRGACCWARSERSPRERARRRSAKACERLDDGVDPARVRSRPTPTRSPTRTFVVEAIVEDHDAKAELLARPGRPASTPTRSSPRTTSSLSVGRARPRRAGARTASSACTSSTPCRG